jgi:hypothetical protein
MLATFSDGLTVTAIGQIPVAYLARESDNTIVLLNTRFAVPQDYAQYVTHLFTGDEKQRNARKQGRRIIVFGTGSIFNAVLTVLVDGIRQQQYLYSVLSPNFPEGVLWDQGMIPIIGRTFEITFECSGTLVAPSEVQMIFVPYG